MDLTLSPKRGPRGGGSITSNGYRLMRFGDANTDGVAILEHRLVAEKALGKPLPAKAEVHHWNENKRDNRGENLVICPDRAYHMLLHRRARALTACGNANWLRCPYCKTYDAPENMAIKRRGCGRAGDSWYHAQCARDYANNRGRLAA